jgi:hypothetical protein
MKMNKKGYAYFVELALSIIIIFLVIANYTESEQTVYEYKQDETLRQTSWHILKNLDDFGAIDSTNFSKINTYIDASYGDFTAFDLEYYNNTGCYPINNGVLSAIDYTECESINATTKNNIISSIYTRFQNNEAESIRLYVWRKL